MNKGLTTTTNVLNLIGGALIVGSFFVKDSSKAVNIRWGALGLFTVAFGVRLTNTSFTNPSKA